MGKSIVQFLAATQELMDFIEKLRTENQSVVAGWNYYLLEQNDLQP